MISFVKIIPRDGVPRVEYQSLGVAQLSIEGICSELEAPASQLRALATGLWAMVGVSRGLKPITLHNGEHQITLRGPTLLFPLKRGTDPEVCLNDVAALRPLDDAELQMLELATTEGEGNEELRRWPHPTLSTTLPRLRTADRRGEPKDLAEKLVEELSTILGAKVVKLKVGLTPPPNSVIQQFSPLLAEMEEAPTYDENKKFLDLPAYAISRSEHFPSPASMILSMLSFYIVMLQKAEGEDQLDHDSAMQRLAEAGEITRFCAELKRKANIGAEDEWPLTVDQWPEEFWK